MPRVFNLEDGKWAVVAKGSARNIKLTSILDLVDIKTDKNVARFVVFS